MPTPIPRPRYRRRGPSFRFAPQLPPAPVILFLIGAMLLWRACTLTP